MKRLRSFAAALGGIAILVALLADLLGISSPGAFGRDQLLLCLFGGMLLLAGLLGRSFARVYRDAALIAVNTVLLLLAVELSAVVGLRAHDLFAAASVDRNDWRTEAYPSVSHQATYYDEQPWSAEYWRDYRRAWMSLDYRPYVIWRKAPYTSETINVDEWGVRETPGAESGDDPYTVFTFGGSTMWGFGSPDDGTIPAHLLEALKPRIDRPVRVRNFGEGAWISTQEAIALLLELQRGNVPDLVIFYDGINDTWVSGDAGTVDTHYSEPHFAKWLEQAPHFELDSYDRPAIPESEPRLVDALLDSYTAELLRRLGVMRGVEAVIVKPFKAEPDEALSEATVVNYLEVQRMVGALASEYGFDYLFFWQPVLGVGEKPLAGIERAMANYLPFPEHWREVYAGVGEAAAELPRLHDLSDVFADEREALYIDIFHVTPVGNRIVAERMAEVIEETLLRTGGLDAP